MSRWRSNRLGRGCWPLLLQVALASGLLACTTPDTVPTYDVERRAFVHRVTAEGTLRAETTTPLSVPPQVRGRVRIAWLAGDGSAVEEGDLVARFDPTDLQENLEEGRTSLQVAGLRVDQSKVESDVKLRSLETKKRVADLQLDYAKRFRRTDLSVFSRKEISEDQIDETLAGERKEHAADSRETQESLSRTELDLLAIEQDRAQLTIDEAQAGLSALEVRAPHDGILTLVRDWRGERPQVGDEMWRGRQIAEIPDLTTMEAEVFVLEADAGGLEAGQSATVTVEAAPETVYPATIQRVDAVAKPRFRGSPVQYFGVVLSFEAKPSQGMKPGQRVKATLTIDEVEDVLVVPRQAVVREEGETQVFVANGKGFEARKVETGSSSLGLVVIESGLEAGEVIALSPPEGAGTSTNEDDGETPALAIGAS